MMITIPAYAARPGFLRRLLAFFAEVLTGSDGAYAVRRQKYTETVKCYGGLIERVCFGYAATAADFDDLKQDVLMNLWTSLPGFKGDCSLKTWIYRLTLNVCVSTLRKSYRRVTTVQLSELYDLVDNDAEQRVAIREMHEAIATLNPLDKAVIMLWLEEESYDDISTITGLSRANVATRMHRAKGRLKSIMTK